MLTALTHLSRSPLEQNIIQPLVLSLLHRCRNVVNMPPGNSQPRGDFLYHSICNWVQDNYAQPLTREMCIRDRSSTSGSTVALKRARWVNRRYTFNKRLSLFPSSNQP